MLNIEKTLLGILSIFICLFFVINQVSATPINVDNLFETMTHEWVEDYQAFTTITDPEIVQLLNALVSQIETIL